MMQHTRPEHRVRAERDWRINAVLIVWAVFSTALLTYSVLTGR